MREKWILFDKIEKTKYKGSFRILAKVHDETIKATFNQNSGNKRSDGVPFLSVSIKGAKTIYSVYSFARLFGIALALYEKEKGKVVNYFKKYINKYPKLPKIKTDVKLDEDITFTDEVIGFIIDSYTGQEKGVRNLKRCIEIIYRKLNLFKLMKPGAKLFDDNSCIKVEFPLVITKELVDKLIKKQEEDNVYHRSMYL